MSTQQQQGPSLTGVQIYFRLLGYIKPYIGMFIISIIGFLIFANGAKPMADMGFAMSVYQVKWWLSGGFLALTLYTSFAWWECGRFLGLRLCR